jgi:hypothetical protein
VDARRRGVGEDPVGQRGAARGVRAGGPGSGDRAQAGDAHQPAVRPVGVVELPDPGVGLPPAGLDRGGGGRGRAPPVGVEAVQFGGGREQQQRLAEGVELMLLVDPVAGDRPPARVARKRQHALVGEVTAGDGVGGAQTRPVLEQPRGDEAHRLVEERRGAAAGGGPAGVALVADPGEAVVVVAPRAGALGQRGRGGGDHPAARARQPGHHRVGVPGVARGGPASERRHPVRPRRLGVAPEPVGRRDRGCVARVEHEHEVLGRALVECER